MSDTLISVSPEWRERAFIDHAKYDEMYARSVREPDGFWPDESISAPFDLPHYGPVRRVTVQPATGPYLPDPVFIAVGEEVLE